ncbi:MAG: hypothetical protein GWP47_00400 [Actinobacteria bacterium]|nr:hypothetical protein [Actinomycetota bacterium]
MGWPVHRVAHPWWHIAHPSAKTAVMDGSMRKRGERSWELRVYAGRSAETGKKQYVSRTVKGPRRDAVKELARLVAQVDDGVVTANTGTVRELVEAWYARGELNWSPTTADGYRSILDRRILPCWGDVPLRRLRTADLDAWYVELRRQGGHDGQPLAPNSVKRIHAVLRTALAQAVRWGWIAVNPAAAASPPQPKGRPQHTIPSPEDVSLLIKRAREANPPLAVFLRLASATGAQQGEICALRWDEVDLVAGTLTIRWSVINSRSRGVVEKDTKTHAERRLSLDSGTVDILLEYRTKVADFIARCGGALEPDAFVFSHEPDHSSPWRPDYVSLSFTRLRERCGLPGVRLHGRSNGQRSPRLCRRIDDARHLCPLRPSRRRAGREQHRHRARWLTQPPLVVQRCTTGIRVASGPPRAPSSVEPPISQEEP